MFERFTQEGRQVIVLSQEEARTLKHSYIGTEHILLGLLREEDARTEGEPVLRSLGVTLVEARERIAQIVGPGDEGTTGQIPFTPRAKKVLELALREALDLGHNWIGPEHVLLGIVRENEGVASRVLLDFDADSLKVRNQVIRVLEGMPKERAVGSPPQRRARLSIDPAFGELAGVLVGLARDVRERLGREPDVGDLLLAIACATDTVAGEALRELDVGLDALWGTLERIRQRRESERKELIEKIEDVRANKELAIEEQRFDEAAKLRDEQRELTARLVPPAGLEERVLDEVRRRLGLTGE